MTKLWENMILLKYIHNSTFWMCYLCKVIFQQREIILMLIMESSIGIFHDVLQMAL